MAVYTQVDSDMLAQFLTRYDVGEAVSLQGITEGIENTNFLLKTTKSQFILTLYEKRTKREDLPYFLGIMDHLAENDFPAPRPICDKSGAALQTLADRPACLISFLGGASAVQIEESHCAALGSLLGNMHQTLQSYKHKRKNEASLGGWIELASATKDDADHVMPGLQAIIQHELQFLKQNWPTDLPVGTIHADLFPDNILFTGSKITGVIDFYFSCTDMLAYDLAVCLNAWCFSTNHVFEAGKAKRLIEMYDICRRLTPAEQDALPALCRGAALRFLLTRLYDWLNPVTGATVSLKDPIDYVKRLQFHQQVKDAASYVV